MKRDFLAIMDFAPEEISLLLKRAIALKAGADASKCPLLGKSIGLFFEKPSTRTRVSFEVASYQLGGHPVYFNPKEIQIGRGETVSDTARVLSGYLDAIILRTHLHSTVQEFAQHATVPVINGLSDLHHPCQALADLMTILEEKGRLEGIKVAFVGDGNNVAHSLIEAAALMNVDLWLACPSGYEPRLAILEKARSKSLAGIKIVKDPHEAVSNADVVYTDVWVSMGQEKDAEKKLVDFREFQINDALLTYAKHDVIVLHCLPAYRGKEITDSVIDGPHSKVFEEAGNRLHTGKALLEFLVR